jgi:hypothetical protein
VSGPAPAIRDRRKHRLLRRLTSILFAGMIDMDFRTVRRHVVLLVVVAFELVVLFNWLSEIFDLPHVLYGAPEAAFRWQAPLAQTLWMTLLLVFVIIVLLVFFKQIRYLEGFMPVCSFCKSIRVGDEWVPLERYLQERADVKMTHSLCPGCAKRYYDYDEAQEQTAAAAGRGCDERRG